MSGTSNSSPIDLDDFWRKASELGARSYAQRNLEEAKKLFDLFDDMLSDGLKKLQQQYPSNGATIFWKSAELAAGAYGKTFAKGLMGGLIRMKRKGVKVPETTMNEAIKYTYDADDVDNMAQNLMKTVRGRPTTRLVQ